MYVMNVRVCLYMCVVCVGLGARMFVGGGAPRRTAGGNNPGMDPGGRNSEGEEHGGIPQGRNSGWGNPAEGTQAVVLSGRNPGCGLKEPAHCKTQEGRTQAVEAKAGNHPSGAVCMWVCVCVVCERGAPGGDHPGVDPAGGHRGAAKW